MNVLIPGRGGRESALAKKLALDGERVFMAPGNGGTEEFAEVATDSIDFNGKPIEAINIPKLIWFAKENNVFTVVGLDNLLGMGIVNEFEKEGREVIVDGGRAINVVALADTPQEARERAYEAADKIGPGLKMRRDIGKTVLSSS